MTVIDDVAVIEQDAQALQLGAIVLSNDSVDGIDGEVAIIAGVDLADTKGNVAFDTMTQSLTYRADTAELRALGAGESVIDTFTYTAVAGVSSSATGTVQITVAGTNDAPTVGQVLTEQIGYTGSTFSYIVADTAFTDIDRNDTIVLSARQIGGAQLPSWLTFDAATRTFIGTPTIGAEGAIQIALTATDTSGLTSQQMLSVQVELNSAPQSSYGLVDVVAGMTTDNLMPNLLANAFDAEGDSIRISSVNTGLLTYGQVVFDEQTQSLTYVADGEYARSLSEGSIGYDSIQYTLTDEHGAAAQSGASFVIAGVNDAPVAVTPIGLQRARQDETFSYTVPTSSFTDYDRNAQFENENLTLSGTLAGGEPLPTWLVFDAATATFSGTPGENDIGNISLQVTATDPLGASVSSAFRIIVRDLVNSAPTAVNDVVGPLVGGGTANLVELLLANDTDADDDALSISRVDKSNTLGNVFFDAPTQTLTYFENADVTRELAAGEEMVDSFGYTVMDEFGAVSSAVASVNIAGVNDAPYTFYSGFNLNIFSGLGFTDSLPDFVFTDDDNNDQLTLTALLSGGEALPSWLSFDNGTFSGLADSSDAGTFDISVMATDLAGASAHVAYTLNVLNQITPPTAVEDQIFVNAGSSTGDIYTQLFANDLDENGILPDRIYSVDTNGLTIGEVSFDSTSQALTYSASSPVFSALAEGETTTDQFVYSVARDDDRQPGLSYVVATSVNVTVTGVNDTPEAQADAITLIASDTTDNLSATLLANDTDVDNNDTRSIIGVEVDSTAGTVDFDAATQSLTYTADSAIFDALNAGETATDQFRYRIADALGAESVAAVDVTLVGVNDAPEAQADIVAIQAGSTINELAAILLGNDTDKDQNDVKIITAVDVTNALGAINFDATTQTLSYAATSAASAAIAALNETDTLTDQFQYTISDSAGAISSAAVTVNIAGQNDAPVVVNALNNVSIDQNATFAASVAANTFADIDRNDALTYTATLADGTPLPTWLAFDAATRTFNGTPGQSAVGNVDIRIIATDKGGLSTSTTTTLTVNNINDAPVAQNDTTSIAAGRDVATDLTELVLANDTDVDIGDTKRIGAAASANQYGLAEVQGGQLIYTTGGAGYDALAKDEIAYEQVQYLVVDTAGASAVANVAIEVMGVNDAIVATADSFTLNQNQGTDNIAAYLLANDIDPDALDTKTITSVNSAGLKGIVEVDLTTQDIRYRGNTLELKGLKAGESTTETFQYTVIDKEGVESSANVVATVTGENDAPILVKDIGDQSITEGTRFTFQLPTDMFTDIDKDDTLSISATLEDGSSLPSWLLYDAGTGILTGLPGNANVGAVTIKLTATDSTGLSASDSFTLNVAANPNPNPGQTINGTNGANTLNGTNGNDTINGLGGSDTINGNAGSDTLLGGNGRDTINANAGNDLVNGGNGADTINGGEGNDVLEGGAGADTITDTSGNTVANGGNGNDTINVASAAGSNNFIIGGAGRDTLNLGAGNDVVAFNRGNGDDIINSQNSQGGGTDTLSLGGGISFEDLQFRKIGDDLRLMTGNGDSLSFTNWYSDPTSRSFVNLQMIQEASGTYNPNGANTLTDNKVETFSFVNLVNSFDQARLANPRLNRWSLMNGALNAHLGGANDAALGGDFAYQYGLYGNLANVGIDAAQALLANAQLNTSAQQFQSATNLAAGQQRLS